METASGLLLNKDSTFEFFFSYGALDRYGSGKWSVQNNNVLLNSKAYPGEDFKIIDSSFVKNSPVTIKIEDANTNLYGLVYCLVKRTIGDTLLNADGNGIIKVPYPVDIIYLMSELCTERISSFPVTPGKYNNYTFHFEPWITEIFFNSFTLRYSDGRLRGKHPLLGDKEYDFERQK